MAPSRFTCCLAVALAAGVSSCPLLSVSSAGSTLTPFVDNHRHGLINNSNIVVPKPDAIVSVKVHEIHGKNHKICRWNPLALFMKSKKIK
jgi:hypothetical protein